MDWDALIQWVWEFNEKHYFAREMRVADLDFGGGPLALPIFALELLHEEGYDDGGGFKVKSGGDRILQYHPGSRHHGDIPYYKISSGKTGTQRYDMQGNLID